MEKVQEKATILRNRATLGAIFTNAIKRGRTEIVGALLNEQINVNSTDFDGWTPLHYAAMHGNFTTNRVAILPRIAGQFTIVKSILQHKDTLILVDRDGNTPLYYLVQKIPLQHEVSLYWQILSLCMRRGHDLNFQNEKGGTVLHEAAFRNNVPATQYFLSSGADLSIKTK